LQTFLNHKPNEIHAATENPDVSMQDLTPDSAASWCTRLRQADVMCAPVHELPETYADPQVQHDGMVWEVDHPSAGRLRVLWTPVHFYATPAGVHRPPPLLGQHTEAILHGAGYSATEITALRQQGVV
jgi:crotonobetainyl-CoA:carnitine CoA-transferase CaiB-like acyl-CoA transferase